MSPGRNPGAGREAEGGGPSDGESGSGARTPRKRGKRGKAVVRPARMPKVEETSAGGLVIDRSLGSPHAVLIARFDRRGRLVWSLPKGHLEGTETPEQAALREVQEETGIEARVIEHLGTIDFWFIAENKRIHKTVHHYLMEAAGGELSDEDPEVEEVAWVPLGDVRDRLAYADERRLMDRLPDLLADAG
ncbi:MAG: NUDIX hydrolase [Ilumatobacteraceae bacterium]